MKNSRLLFFTITLVMILGAGTIPAQAVEPKIAAGGDHTVVLKKDGTLWSWGLNFRGQLGDGTYVDKNTPVQIGTDTDWTAVSAGSEHTTALKADGTLWAWGYLLGDGQMVYQNVPLQIGTDTDWTAVSAGAYHNIALKADKKLWVWGDNSYGELGDGTNVSQITPVPIRPGSTWTTVEAGGAHSLGVMEVDATLWAWGSNSDGQLGDYVVAESPCQIGIDKTWSAVAGGQYHTLAVQTGGALWAWGSNSDGQLGNGDDTFLTPNYLPVKIGLDTTWTTVTAGKWHSLARKADGTLWACGLNGYGQLGAGTDVLKSNVLVQVAGTTWTAVEAGGYFTIGLKEDGTLWAWGDNTYGQLGDGTDGVDASKNTPVQIMNLSHDTLAVTKTGTGSGTVTSVHTGIDCGADCSEEYDYNTVVTLNAAPVGDSIFLGWSGGNCAGTGECVVTMDNNKTISASFQRPFYWPMFLPAITKRTP